MRFAAVCLVLAACKPSPPPKSVAMVGTLLVSTAEIASRLELATTADEVRVLLRDQLLATRRFDIREGAPGRIALSVERAEIASAPAPMVDPGKTAPDRDLANVVVSLELGRPDSSGQEVTLRAEGLSRRPLEQGQSLDPEARRAAFASALGIAIHEAAEALADQIDAHAKSDQALIADLGSADVRIRDYAIRVLAERRNPAAVPKLIERLDDPDPTVWLRAVGALTAIGDRRAVVPLIEATRKRRPEETGSVLYAIATLGGPAAEAYLFTLESGAPDEQVRRAAREAYAELLRNKRSDGARGAKNP
ncbi:MAG TPA: HEAT repeat domain-containing protein [Myxococcales bacterium]|jgi:HEAT repeat protein